MKIKNLVLSLLMIAVLVLSVGIVYAGEGCVDDDSKDFYFYGHVQTGKEVVRDNCIDDDTVIEMYCSGDTLMSEEYVCPFGCYENACNYYMNIGYDDEEMDDSTKIYNHDDTVTKYFELTEAIIADTDDAQLLVFGEVSICRAGNWEQQYLLVNGHKYTFDPCKTFERSWSWTKLDFDVSDLNVGTNTFVLGDEAIDQGNKNLRIGIDTASSAHMSDIIYNGNAGEGELMIQLKTCKGTCEPEVIINQGPSGLAGLNQQLSMAQAQWGWLITAGIVGFALVIFMGRFGRRGRRVRRSARRRRRRR